MEAGITVFGASSMGALRAAELATFGMIGIGRIFEAYRDGEYRDDDEVAVLHTSAVGQYRALSEPMVNIRATVEHAIRQRVIGAEVGELVIACAKQTFYQERSLKGAVEQARAAGAPSQELEPLLRFVENDGNVDQKRLDALELIRTLARLEASPANGRQSDNWVSRSRFLCMLQVDVACRPFEEEKAAFEARSSGSTYRLLCDLAQLLSLADAVARTRGIQPALEGIERLFDRDDFGLGPEARDPGWAESNDLDEAEFERFVRRLDRIRALAASGASHHYLLALLRIHGEYDVRGARTARRTQSDAVVLRNLAQQDNEKFRLYRRLAKLWRVVDQAAKARGVATSVPRDDLQKSADHFRRERGLESRQATRAWLRRNNLDLTGFADLMTLDLRLSMLFRNAQTQTLGAAAIADDVCWFHDALRLTGFYTRLKHATRRIPSADRASAVSVGG